VEDYTRDCCGVGMAQGNEMGTLGELVNDCEDDRFVVDAWKALDEIHRDI
jgi:hypothetical protein